jgi:hypothetical protein
MMEISSRQYSITYHQHRIPIWIVASISILLTGLTVVGIIVVSDNNEYKLHAHSTPKFIMEDPVLHTRRHLRITKNKVRRRRTSHETDQLQQFIVENHRQDSQHLQEILYFLNHL